MTSAKSIIGVVVAAVILVSMFTPLTNVIAGSTGTQNVANESVTADVGNYTNLKGYDLKEGSVTVTGNGTTYSEGTDYEIDYKAGELKALSSGSIADGETLDVSYDYQAADNTTSTITGLIPLVMALVGVMMFAQKMDL